MKVLAIEDNPEDAQFLRACLNREGPKHLELVDVATMKDAVESIRLNRFDVVLLDLNLPDTQGRESVEKIKNADPDLPLVVLSGQGDEDFAVEILSSGVQDYLVKWEGGGRIILRAIRYAIERKRAENRLHYLASYDSLTGVPNRQYFREQLNGATARARRHKRKLGIVFLDLDRFKGVNDTFGHQSGDELLKVVVSRLRGAIRAGDLLARLGGDEFAVMIEDVEDPLQLEAVAENILATFEEPFDVDGHPFSITASLGITIFPSDNTEPLGLLNNADIAMYQAKDLGRNNFKFFTQTMHEELIRYHLLQSDLKMALERSEFELLYQPQFNLADGRAYTCEALLRWNHPQRGLIRPHEFIAVAEENGHIIPIGVWLLEHVCKQLQEWEHSGLSLPRIAINISPQQLHQPQFPQRVESALRRHSVSPALIELELTEGSLMQDTEDMQRCLRDLKAIGVRLAIDDFGTGYSCLSYLKQFPIDVLKIDRSFVADIGVNDDGQAICGVILSIAKRLGLETVAEGVENERQLAFLTEQGCEYAQGYRFARPMKPADLRHKVQLQSGVIEPVETASGGSTTSARLRSNSSR